MQEIQTLAWDLTIAHLPAVFRAWLGFAGSFMDRLREYGILDARIEVVKESMAPLTLCEQQYLNIEDKSAFIREVLILNDACEWMFARTIIPDILLNQDLPALKHLGSNSLGSILFKHPKVQRSKFWYALLSPDHPWHKKVNITGHLKQTIYGRRSLFTLNAHSLLLTEFFFPAIFNLCKKK